MSDVFYNMWWHAPAAEGGGTQGTNDSSVETFNGHMVSALAREICQNSVDARKNDDAPVVVEFAAFSMDVDDFPGINTFQSEMEASRLFWKQRNDAQACEFFNKARAKLKNKIHWMRISDFNTTGLTGVSKANDPYVQTAWDSLVKSAGVSNKPASGVGSFGIGKSAAFSCSQLRTVFYATKTIENEEGFIGVARIPSYPLPNKPRMMTTGRTYFEMRKDGAPLSTCISLDPNFKRTETGTDVYIPIFLPMYTKRRDWKVEIVNAMLDGFLYAIYHHRLVVKIKLDDEEIVLDKAYLDNKYGPNTITSEDKVHFLIQQKYLLLTSEAAKVFEFKYGNYSGYIDIRFLLGPIEYDRRVTMVRAPGMKIFDKANFPAKISFTGMAVICGDGLNALFKSMENPAHTEWTPERNPHAEEAMKELYRFCRDKLLDLVATEPGEEIDSGLGAILPQDDEDEGDKKEENSLTTTIVNTPGKSRKRKPQIQPLSTTGPEEPIMGVSEPMGEPGSGGGDYGTTQTPIQNPGKPGENPGDQAGPHPGSIGGTDGGGTPSESFHSVNCLHLRYFCMDRNRGIYGLMLTPSADAKVARLKVLSVAENQTYPAPVLTAECAGQALSVDTVHGIIEGLSLQKDKQLMLVVTFDYSDYLSLEVECYGHN